MIHKIKCKITQLRHDVKKAAMSSVLQAYGLLLTTPTQQIIDRIKFLNLDYGFAFEDPDNVSMLSSLLLTSLTMIIACGASPTPDILYCRDGSLAKLAKK